MRACPPSGRGRGTGPDGDKFRRGGTQETLGGAEAKRSPEEGLCPALAKRPDIKKKPAKNLFLVGLIIVHYSLYVFEEFWCFLRLINEHHLLSLIQKCNRIIKGKLPDVHILQ